MARSYLLAGFIGFKICSHCLSDEHFAEITFDESSVGKNYDCIIGEKAAASGRSIRFTRNPLS